MGPARSRAPGVDVPAVLCAVGSYACIWWVQAIALDTRDWFSVITTELAGNAFNRITPGGGATGTALQATMLRAAGFDGAARGHPHSRCSPPCGTAALVALPLFSIPFVVAGTQVPSGLLPGGLDRHPGVPGDARLRHRGVRRRRAVALARSCRRGRAASCCTRTGTICATLGDRLLRSRDTIFRSVAPKWRRAVAASVLRWLFEYGVLVSALYGLGVRPDPALVLLAFTTASVLGLLPFTPGGLGFVEAGLTATLNLAGVPVGAALVATLVYRLLTFWLPLPIGGVAAAVFRRRHRRRGAGTGDVRHLRVCARSAGVTSPHDCWGQGHGRRHSLE